MNMKTVCFCAAFGMGLVGAAQSAWAADSSAPTGDQHRTYSFARTGDTLPYRLFVPATYHGEKDYPLVVVLHGGGGSENGPMDGTGLEEEAGKRGYVVLSPLGYNRFGGYGNIYPVVVSPTTAAGSTDFAALARSEGPGKAGSSAPPPPPPGARPPSAAAREDEYLEQPAGVLTDAHVGELSEAETLAALADVRSHYRIDARRIYLMGNSAGGVGTLYLAAKYPQNWAAIAPQGGVIAAWSYPYQRLRDAHLPVLFVHGDHDEHCNAKWSKAMADAARAAGADSTYLLVSGGTHSKAWTKALPQIFDFFDAHVRTDGAANGKSGG